MGRVGNQSDQMRDGPMLVIETSGRACAAGVFSGAGELSRCVVEMGRGHADAIVDLCSDALREASRDWRDLRSVAVCVGPGSFTGIRAGVAAARGFSLALGIPAVGVSALDAMALAAPGTDVRVVVARDARRGQVYARAFDSGVALGDPVIDSTEAIAAGLTGELTVIGSGAPPLVEALTAAGRDARIGTRGGAALLIDAPDVAHVAEIARLAGDALPPEPLYLRSADAKPAAPSPALEVPA